MVLKLGYYTASTLVIDRFSKSEALHWTTVTTPAVSGLCSLLPFIQVIASRSDSTQASLSAARLQWVTHIVILASTSWKPQLEVLCTSVTLTHQHIFASVFYAILSSFLKLCSLETAHNCDLTTTRISKYPCWNSLVCTMFIFNLMSFLLSYSPVGVFLYNECVKPLLSVCLVMSPTINYAQLQLLPLC